MTKNSKSLIYNFQPKVVSVTGADARDFLQRLSTVNLRLKEPAPAGESKLLVRGALPRANGSAHALFLLAIENDQRFHLVFFGNEADDARAYLDNMHFGEDLSIDDQLSLFAAVSNEPILDAEWSLPNFLKHPQAFHFALSAHKREVQGEPLSDDEFKSLRLLNGLPTVGHELGRDQLILEFPLDVYVQRNKGCYPGQEVLERLYTYGNAARFACVVVPTSAASAFQELKAEACLAEIRPSERLQAMGVPPVFRLALIPRLKAKIEEHFRFDFEPATWQLDPQYLNELLVLRAQAKSE